MFVRPTSNLSLISYGRFLNDAYMCKMYPWIVIILCKGDFNITFMCVWQPSKLIIFIRVFDMRGNYPLSELLV